MASRDRKNVCTQDFDFTAEIESAYTIISPFKLTSKDI